MDTRTTPSATLLLTTMAVAILGVALSITPVTAHAPAPIAPAAPAGPEESAGTNPPAPDAPGIYGADAELTAEIESAMARFDSAGLTLPELRIYAHATNEGCQGHIGLFNGDQSGNRIDLCVRTEYLILHELAHAWEHHFMTESTREAFLDHTGLTTWNHIETDWDERGIEAAAQAIAWGLLDTPITNADAFPEELHQFELLTGIASPRVAG